MTSKLEEFVAKTQDLAGGIGDTLVLAFEARSDAVGSFVKTGKSEIRGLVVDMIANFAKLSVQKYIFGPLAGVLSGALGGSGLVTAANHHDGGMAGGGRGRTVPASVFDGARRTHGHGSAGLAPDEIPAILRRGARMQNPPETRDYLLRIATRGLADFDRFLVGKFTKVPEVASIKSSIPLPRVKTGLVRTA